MLNSVPLLWPPFKRSLPPGPKRQDTRGAISVSCCSPCSSCTRRLAAISVTIHTVRGTQRARYPAVTYSATGASGAQVALVETRGIVAHPFSARIHRCISVCRPSVCPLCRKKFSNSHVTKLRTADVGDGGAETSVCSPVSASLSTSSCLFERRDSLRGKDFDDRVAAHIKETGEMIKEVTERVYLQHAIEATLRAQLTEVERERDGLLS